MDKFRIELLAATPHPQQLIWAAMHQDYSEDAVYDQRDKFPDEAKAGELIIKYLLAGNKGHFGPLEHPQITVNVCGFPHSMMQQIRTHRVGITFDVQCLAGATEVTFVNTNGETSKKHKKKIAELHDLWVNGEKAVRERKIRGRNGEEPGTYRRNCRQRIQKMKLRVLNEETGQFEVGHIQDVMCNGLQPVYRLTLANSSILDCTVNHRILTPNGWQTMADAIQLVTDDRGEVFSIGENCQVLCNGIPIQAGERPYTNKLWLEYQINQGKNAVEMAKLLDCTSATIQTLKAHAVKVIAAEYLGMQMTYDLEVAGSWHNFVANGVVVHNSFRYTGTRITDILAGKRELEDVFYLRPVGDYTNRQGKKYYYSPEQRQADLDWCLAACQRYGEHIAAGMAEEQARSIIPFDVRQHFVMSCNVRSLMHLLDLRWKKDAQLEAQQFAELLFAQFEQWVPAIAQWYLQNRAQKAKLSP